MNTMKNIFVSRLLGICLMIVLAGCSGSPGSSSTGDSTGSIAARLDWGQGKKSAAKGTDLYLLSDTRVVTVRIVVTGPDMAAIQKDFPAADGQGLIEAVPAGSNRTVTALGLDSGGATTYKGSKGSISVDAGQTTDAGTITMLPVGPVFSNANLNGPWLLDSKEKGRTYIIFDGNGGVTGLGAFNPATFPGTYQVQADGSFTLNIAPGGDPLAVLAGTLTSPNSGGFTVTQGTRVGETGNLIRVVNPAACQGTWFGNIGEPNSPVTRAISFTVDENGGVTSFAGFALPVTGRMFCESGIVAAFFRTGEPNVNNQIKFTGTIAGSAIAGSFSNDSNISGGTVSLSTTPPSVPPPSVPPPGGTLPVGFPSNVPTGEYTISVLVCSSGFCNSGGSFIQINTDINQFAQLLIDALSAANNQVLANDCAQAGCSCPAATISYTPWDGTSFTITDSFTVTCASGISSVSIQYTVTRTSAAP
jgi:hypothetical protein